MPWATSCDGIRLNYFIQTKANVEFLVKKSKNEKCKSLQNLTKFMGMAVVSVVLDKDVMLSTLITAINDVVEKAFMRGF